ncbi:bacteriophage abortive infection AbiH family protein [Bacteroides thetaiotaomicron]|jgi:hypothetical protein|uniref:bacteriophage abortive infection AbiH family protein n=2 Tax=Bacteroides thetaiotaomicron TaxID=818 RepID=UPI001CE32477|nr:bacteriophage abortive infection AbiH family protein [Bacteroides thetaiotaomicron]MCA6047478.1 bacteriophage abortive infection AbiH family protein [Bacteroides thetaiotaomicron]
MNIGNSDILYSFDRARLIDRARNGFMRIDGLTFKRARDYMAKYSARDYLMQCPLDLSTKELVSGMKDYCLQRRAEILEPYRKKRYSIHGDPIHHLYIIGNGFDRYHGADSTYMDFRSYLLKHNDFVVKMFELFFGPRSMMNNFDDYNDFLLCLQYGRKLPAPKNTWAKDYLWKDFEKYLSELNRERIFDFVDENLPRLYEDDESFSYAEYFAPIDIVADVVSSCTFEMQYQFHRWINTIHYKKGFRKNMLYLDPNAAYLNFNYTLFLETEYNISREHILYIHGDRRQKFGSLVLGHNVEDNEVAFDEWVHKHKNRRRYRPNLKDKKGKYFANDKLVYLAFFLEDMKKGNWKNPIRYYAVDHIEERLENYYAKNIKHSNDIIDHNLGFFESLNDLKEITLLGHSLGDVDFPYFKAIVENVRNVNDLIWNFSYYSDNDIINIRRFCRHLNIPQGKNVRHFKMSDIKR